jgi:poly(3-hydroxybutyrate) depolymerase
VRLHDFGRCGVVFYEIQGGGHGWPGGVRSTDPRAERILGHVTREINATSVMLDFFRRYGL